MPRLVCVEKPRQGKHVGDPENRSALAARHVQRNLCRPIQNANIYFATDLKSTTDDALPNSLNSLKFKQIHTSTDVRLVLGYTAVTIAGALFYYDWKFGWEASKPFTLPAVVAYFVLNTAFTYWLWFVEKGLVYEGEGKTGKVRIRNSGRRRVFLCASKPENGLTNLAC